VAVQLPGHQNKKRIWSQKGTMPVGILLHQFFNILTRTCLIQFYTRIFVINIFEVMPWNDNAQASWTYDRLHFLLAFLLHLFRVI
jgi:hypothetical protein